MLNDKSVKQLVDGIMDDAISQEINLLDLSYNYITDKGCKEIARLFDANYKFKNLILGKNMHITAEGLTSITESIQANNSINTIDMSVCNIEMIGSSKVKLL